MIWPRRLRYLLRCCLGGFLLVTCTAILAAPAHAVPTLLTYQGFLTDNSNAPATGTHTMAFKLFPDSTNGQPLWSESYASVIVTAGVFNVVLGSSEPLPPSVFSGATLWLQTTVDDVDILPRRPVLSVAYALRAAVADSAARVAPSIGDITGHVTMRCTASNGVGVLVYIPGRSFVAYTNAAGDFDLSSVPPGTYALHVESTNPPDAADVASISFTANGTTNVGVITVGTNLATDPQNCGTCANVCAFSNAAAACSGGSCEMGACNFGYANCDGSPSTGCEVNIRTDPYNCGTCSNVCVTPHATPACVNASCQVGTCDSGYADCDSKQAGCETNTNSDPSNCGACGNRCAGGHACSSGVCL